MTATVTMPVQTLPPCDKRPQRIPWLENGDHLSQPEFHRRYSAMPSHIRAELIGGRVYMSSPLRLPHGRASRHLAALLGVYQAATPGVDGMDNTTTVLGEDSEPQPDHALRILPEFGGQSRENAEQYLVGAPELIIEIAHSSLSVDLHEKKADYRGAKVREYIVLCVEEQQLRAFDLPAGKVLPVSSDGIYRSKVFPGLWISTKAFFGKDLAGLLRVGRRGLKSPDHKAFVKQMKAKVAKRPKR